MTASAFSQNFHLRSCLVHAQWSLAPDENFEKPPCQIPDSSGCFGIDPDLIKRLCHRHTGIGADGVLVIEMSEVADCRMRIFNADGSEPAMCGNGLRCAFDFLSRQNGSSSLNIEIGQRIITCKRVGNKIAVNLGSPRIVHWPIELELQSQRLSAYVLDTGVMHAVVFVDNVLDIPILRLGQEIRFHSAFAPHGTNVNFAKLESDGSILLRTYERGVEGETLSCGTGAAATAWTAVHVHEIWTAARPMTGIVSIKTRSDRDSQRFEESMRFSFPRHLNGQKEMEMIGPAELVFTGQIDLKNKICVMA